MWVCLEWAWHHEFFCGCGLRCVKNMYDFKVPLLWIYENDLSCSDTSLSE